MKSTTTRSTRSQQRAKQADSKFIIVIGVLFVIIIGTIVLLNRMGAQPQAAPNPAPLDASALLPLASPVRPIRDFHDMPNIPQMPVQGQTLPADTPQANVDLPMVRWDWGTIPRKPPVEQTFPIQNRGNQPLLITGVVTSCGCTTADLTSSVIPGGQRADLRVIFDPDFHDTSGPVTRIVWVSTNDPDMPVVELRLDANVSP